MALRRCSNLEKGTQSCRPALCAGRRARAAQAMRTPGRRLRTISRAMCTFGAEGLTGDKKSRKNLRPELAGLRGAQGVALKSAGTGAENGRQGSAASRLNAKCSMRERGTGACSVVCGRPSFVDREAALLGAVTCSAVRCVDTSGCSCVTGDATRARGKPGVGARGFSGADDRTEWLFFRPRPLFLRGALRFASACPAESRDAAGGEAIGASACSAAAAARRCAARCASVALTCFPIR